MRQNNYARNLIIIAHVYLAVLVIVLTGILSVKFCDHYSKSTDQVRSYATEILVNYKADGFDNALRERRENLFYVTAVFAVTIVSFLSLFFSKKYFFPLLVKSDLRKSYQGVIAFSVVTLLIFLFFAITPSYHVLGSEQKLKIYSSFLAISGGIFLAAIVIFYEVGANNFWRCWCKFFSIFFVIISSALIVSYGIFDQYSSALEPVAINFSPVVYPIIQQYLGGELLVNFKSYYGLHPYFMQLFLHIFPATILTLSLAFAALFLVSLLALAWLIFSIIENKFLALLGFIALIFLQNFAVIWWPSESALQFQYESIRLFFPALILILIANFCRDHSTKKYYFTLFLAAISTLWNLDSGLPLFLTTVIILGHEKLKNNFSWKIFLSHFAKSFAIAGLVWLTLIIFIKIKSGFWPNFSWIFYGQKAAFNLAMSMLPADAAGLWYIVILTYVVGLIVAINNFLTKNHSLQNSLMLALAVLGVGLFTYFVGRSHEVNLLHCSYPAVILLIIFSDKFCRNFSKRSNPKIAGDWLILSLPLFFVSYLSAVFFFNLATHPLLKEKFIINKFSAKARQHKPYWVLESDFIKQHIHFDGKTVREDILTITTNDLDFYFDLEFLTRSPLNIINIRQSFYQKDFDEIYDVIANKKEKFVILILSQKKEVPPAMSKEEIKTLQKCLEKYYKLSAKLQIGDNDATYIYEAFRSTS